MRALQRTLLPLAAIVVALPLQAQYQRVRIVQTNAAGDNAHIIDPATNTVVGTIHELPMVHGVTSAPDGSALYFSNEVDHTLDIVPAATMSVSRQIPLSGRPNNIAITPDGKKLYVAITRGDAFVDVIDLEAGRVVKAIPTAGGVHNVFITPDGKYIAAGMIGARTLTIIDTETDEPAWSLTFDGKSTGDYPDGGVRPMAFEANADGSTKRIFVQISNYHGFYVIDFETRAVVQKVAIPELPISRVSNDALQGSPAHGLAVSPDGSQVWSTSKPNDHVYVWSLPNLQLLGGVHVGHHPDWLTMTPDGRYLYVANAGSNDVSVIDAETIEEVARIKVGQAPKRNHTWVVPVVVP